MELLKATGENLLWWINAIGKIFTGIPEAFGIDEWYIFYIAISIICLFKGLITKKFK